MKYLNVEQVFRRMLLENVFNIFTQTVPRINMGSSYRCRYWSLLQVVVIFVGSLGKSSGAKVAQDCVRSQLNLRCPEMQVIQITAVVLGKHQLLCWSSCCIKDSDCTVNPNEDHRRDVHRKCDNKRSCTVDVLEEGIDCGALGKWTNNDFERITYDCIDDLRNSTAATSSWASSTADNRPTTGLTAPTSTRAGSTAEDIMGVVPVVVVAVCFVLISVIVAIVMLRRKMKSSGIETDQKEPAYVNKDQLHVNSVKRNADNFTEVENSLVSEAQNFKSPASDYCDLTRMATEGIKSDNEYEQLDHGRNYEQLAVYAQLQEISRS